MGKWTLIFRYENAAAFESTLVEAGYDVELTQFGEGHTVPIDLTIQTILDVVKE